MSDEERPDAMLGQLSRGPNIAGLKHMPNVSRQVELAVPMTSGGLVFSLSYDGNLNASAPLELHLIAMFVSQRIFNAEISMQVVGSVNGNLCLFR
jgi:hypothetical protein